MPPQTCIQLREYEMALAHTPVLLDELVELLRPAAGETAIDCTFGAGWIESPRQWALDAGS